MARNESSQKFAEDQLLVALEQSNFLPDAERDKVAAQMSAFIGLSASTIAMANLRIDPQVFLETLIADRLVGRLDTRVTGPGHSDAMVEGRDKAVDDPALGIGVSLIAFDPVVADYLHGIGVRAESPYVGLNLDMNLNLDWAYGGRQLDDTVRLNPTPFLAELMEKRDHLKLLHIGGYFDLTCPVLGQRHALSRSSIPTDHLRMVAFEGPYAVYAPEPVRKIVLTELKALIQKTAN